MPNNRSIAQEDQHLEVAPKGIEKARSFIAENFTAKGLKVTASYHLFVERYFTSPNADLRVALSEKQLYGLAVDELKLKAVRYVFYYLRFIDVPEKAFFLVERILNEDKFVTRFLVHSYSDIIVKDSSIPASKVYNFITRATRDQKDEFLRFSSYLETLDHAVVKEAYLPIDTIIDHLENGEMEDLYRAIEKQSNEVSQKIELLKELRAKALDDYNLLVRRSKARGIDLFKMSEDSGESYDDLVKRAIQNIKNTYDLEVFQIITKDFIDMGSLEKFDADVIAENYIFRLNKSLRGKNLVGNDVTSVGLARKISTLVPIPTTQNSPYQKLNNQLYGRFYFVAYHSKLNHFLAEMQSLTLLTKFSETKYAQFPLASFDGYTARLVKEFGPKESSNPFLSQRRAMLFDNDYQNVRRVIAASNELDNIDVAKELNHFLAESYRTNQFSSDYNLYDDLVLKNRRGVFSIFRKSCADIVSKIFK